LAELGFCLFKGVVHFKKKSRKEIKVFDDLHSRIFSI